MSAANECWECGKPTSSGVCMGPHPNFSWLRARAAGNVSGGPEVHMPRKITIGNVQEQADSVVRAIPAPAPPSKPGPKIFYCPECGRRLTPDPLGLWCESCVVVAEVLA